VIPDPRLVLAWLLLAHLVADFVIQTESIATDKFDQGSRGWWGLFRHWIGVAACLVPFVVAFGANGFAVLLVVSVGHAAIDRAKVLLTRRAEARALEAAHRLHEGPAPEASLGTAWTPIPAGLFALDQLAHVALIGVAWAVWLAGLPPTPGFAVAVDGLLGGWDRAAVEQVTLAVLVGVALLIVNLRAGALFVATLVHPREAVTGHDVPAPAAPSPAPPSYTFRVGPLIARAEADKAAQTAGPPRLASTARVGATIGVLERLLIVGFVLSGASAAVGFVIAAKTIARFRQLDDRAFAEYYLLGTLASVSVALASAFAAAAALGIDI
jgi:hypothetical protein